MKRPIVFSTTISLTVSEAAALQRLLTLPEADAECRAAAADRSVLMDKMLTAITDAEVGDPEERARLRADAFVGTLRVGGVVPQHRVSAQDQHWLSEALEREGLDLVQGFDCRHDEHRVAPRS